MVKTCIRLNSCYTSTDVKDIGLRLVEVTSRLKIIMCDLIVAIRRQLCRMVAYIWVKCRMGCSYVSYIYYWFIRGNEFLAKQPISTTQRVQRVEIRKETQPLLSILKTYTLDKAYSIFNYLSKFPVQTKQPNITIQRHEKVMRKVLRSDGADVIERLSKRYGLSEDVQTEILLIIDDPAQTGEFSFGGEDEKYSVNVRMRETDFDIHLHSCQIIEDID